MKKTISLNIVVYNEGHRIYKTLLYAHPFVDEIVIVDQQSTDNTREEIYRFARDFEIGNLLIVEDGHWGYCEPSRKLAHKASTGDYILVLDADERISQEFALDIKNLINSKFYGVRMMRSLWLGGHHRFTGDLQYRFFKKDAVRFLDEIHTEPQPTVSVDRIFDTPYVAIWHEKSWEEQLLDEENYEKLIPQLEKHENKVKTKLALNKHINYVRKLGLSGKQIDALPDEKLEELGFAEGNPPPDFIER
jgi:glycosyltransferase involved in cell wall biosynthesis